MTRGRSLIREIDECRVGPGDLAFWWLGQHSFIVKAGDAVIYLDPFLTRMPGRLVAPLLQPEEVTHAAIICGTHDHADHIDREAWPALACASPAATFVVPDLLKPALVRDIPLLPDRLAGIDDGTSVTIGKVKITGVAAAHEFLDQDPATGRYPYLGVVVEANGCVFYHAGDCCLYEGLVTRLRRWKLDLAFLPINGRDARRLKVNCIGNMTYQEAADLAGALSPRLTVPAHYDMFAINLGDVQAFEDYMKIKYPRLPVCTPGYGQPVHVNRTP